MFFYMWIAKVIALDIYPLESWAEVLGMNVEQLKRSCEQQTFYTSKLCWQLLVLLKERYAHRDDVKQLLAERHPAIDTMAVHYRMSEIEMAIGGLPHEDRLVCVEDLAKLVYNRRMT